MQEYYARSSERNVLRHAQYKYKDKYRSKKSGKWVYVYDDIKGAVNKVGNAIGEATGYNAKKRYQQATKTANTLANDSRLKADQKTVKSQYAKVDTANKLHDALQNRYYSTNSEAEKDAIRRQYSNEVTPMVNDIKKNANDAADRVATRANAANEAQLKANTAKKEYEKSLAGTVDSFIKSSSKAIDKGKNFISSLFKPAISKEDGWKHLGGNTYVKYYDATIDKKSGY